MRRQGMFMALCSGSPRARREVARVFLETAARRCGRAADPVLRRSPAVVAQSVLAADEASGIKCGVASVNSAGRTTTPPASKTVTRTTSTMAAAAEPPRDAPPYRYRLHPYQTPDGLRLAIDEWYPRRLPPRLGPGQAGERLPGSPLIIPLSSPP